MSCDAAGSCQSSPRKHVPNIKGLGELRYVVEQTFALIYHIKRLAVR